MNNLTASYVNKYGPIATTKLFSYRGKIAKLTQDNNRLRGKLARAEAKNAMLDAKLSEYERRTSADQIV